MKMDEAASLSEFRRATRNFSTGTYACVHTGIFTAATQSQPLSLGATLRLRTTHVAMRPFPGPEWCGRLRSGAPCGWLMST